MKASDEVQIKIIQGAEASRIVNPFYMQHSGKALARDSDVFFVATLADEIVGAVRFCVEFDTPMLRSMMINERHRRQGIGRTLLQEFAGYLDGNAIRNTFCLPYGHLLKFYGAIGFELISEASIPPFLSERLVEYRKKPEVFLCMRRP